MDNFKTMEAWFVTGSQNLYGQDVLKMVAEDSRKLIKGLNASSQVPVRLVFKPVVTTPEAIVSLVRKANASPKCIGLVCWMHTFSPAKMWINGLKALTKPIAHLHTQFNRNIPWSEIDMDFMNLNQSAHGGREFGFILSRMRKARRVIVGHWQDKPVQQKLGTWLRAAAAWHDAQGAKIARFGDNMRHVAVTEGDKVEAQIRFGYEVHGYGIGEIVDKMQSVTDAQIGKAIDSLEQTHELEKPLRKGGKKHKNLREEMKMELALRSFLEEGGFAGFTSCFEHLHDVKQLPGLSTQRLMADGYGYGAEGDWKTAALVRAFKVMGQGLSGGSSFMEDYTYDLDPTGGKVLGAHMLEICESIAPDKCTVQARPLGIGGKDDPVRSVFNAAPGPAINVTIVDMGDRFRCILNQIDVVEPEADLPKLPVARALWQPKPDLATSAEAWIQAGGAHHFAFSQSLTIEHIEDFAEMAQMELLVIDDKTDIRTLKNEMRWNDVYFQLRR
jgi:L-arabinose isomerase